MSEQVLAANKEIEQKLKEAYESYTDKQANSKKFALVGLSSSGKSTVFHCLQNYYSNDSDSVNINKDFIRQHCYQNAINLSLFMNDGQYYEHLKTLSVKVVNDWKQIADIITKIWSSKKIQFLYPQRKVFKLPEGVHIADNIGYYFNNIETIMSFDYEPVFKDQLYSICYPSSPFSYLCAQAGEQYLEIFDIPVRLTRRKRMFLFQGMHAVIYVADLTRYCKVMEDGSNALEHDIAFFKRMIGEFWSSEIILLLNKDDIFRQQLAYGLPFASFQNKRFIRRFRREETLMDLDNKSMTEILSVTGYMRRAYNGRNIDEFVPFDIINLIQEFLMDDGWVLDMDELYHDALRFIEDLFESATLDYSNRDYWREPTKTKRTFNYVTSAIDGDLVQQIFQQVQNIVAAANWK